MMANKQMSVLLALALALSLGATWGCSSSSSGGGSTTTSESQTSDMAQAALSTGSLASAGSALAGLTTASALALKAQEDMGCSVNGEVVSCSCPDGGTFTLSGNTMDFDKCSIDGDTVDGLVTFTSSGDSVTVTLTGFSATGDSGTFAIDGKVTVTNDVKMVFALTGAFDGETISLDGTFTTNSDGTLDGTFTATGDDFSGTCTFNDFDPSTATDEAYASACTVN